MKKKRMELLAPAGSMESLKAAIHAGADAVYMGGSCFGARAYADNPEGDRLLTAIEDAHLHGVKLYLTVNTLLKELELEKELYQYLLPCYEHGLDAVIVQDLGVLTAIRRWFPDLAIHASTQMTLCGAGGAMFLKREGIDRIVLARELSLAEIAAIHRRTGLEIECFVHGALCYCYSGQCLFSSILGGRSGNRGRCAQPCRLAYEVFADGKKISRKSERTLLSPKDICALELLPKIAEAGVYSLKIEGRMKRPEYTAGVVRIYRKYLDLYLKYGAEGYRVSKEDQKELLLLFNRDGFSRGYYEQHNGRDMMALHETPAAPAEKRAYEERIAYLRKEYVETDRKIPVEGRLYAKAGQPMELCLCTEAGESLTVYGACPQIPKNHPMEEEKFRKQLEKTGHTPFRWTRLKIYMEGELFVPVQALNDLRRETLDRLRAQLLSRDRRTAPKSDQGKEELSAADIGGGTVLHVSVENKEQLQAVLAMGQILKRQKEMPLTAIYVEAEGSADELSDTVLQIHKQGLRAYVLLPLVFRLKTNGRYYKEKERWRTLEAEGYVIRNLEEYEFLREIGWTGEYFLDHSVYTWNRRSCDFWRKKGIRMQTCPLELNEREQKELAAGDRILIIYGRYPMMVTAGCLHKTLRQCRQQQETWTLKDRYQKQFPVVNHCQDCYNVIYNSQPVYLLDQWEELRRLGVGAFRISFTTEKKEETEQILQAFLERKKPEKDFTRGHFKRGVE